MRRYTDLVPISAKVRRKQNKMSLMCIVLAVFLVTVIFGMADMYVKSERLQAYKTDGNWHAAVTDISDQQAELIAARPDVTASSWYGVLNYNGDAGYTILGKNAVICGTDQELLTDIFTESAIEEGHYPLKKGEALLTKNAKEAMGLHLGDTVSVDTANGKKLKFVVSGFVEATSKLMKEDSYGVFLTTKAFRSIYPGVSNGTPSEYNSIFYLQLSIHENIQNAIKDIGAAYHLSKDQILQNTKLLGLLGQSRDSFMIMIYSSALVLFILVLIAGILMIASSLNSNVAQRTEFFGMMRCIGATPKQIMRLVRIEALRWCKFAIPLGVGAGVMVTWLLCAVLRFLSPSYFSEMPFFGISWISIVSGILIGLLTVLLAARAPARRAAKVSPLTAVSGNAASAAPVRKAANTRFFKVDTALGIHHAKASKKNFILMVGSFALSIVLFLSFSATVDFMNHSIQPLQPWTPDLSLMSADKSCSIDRELSRQLRKNPAVDRLYGRMSAYDIPAKINGEHRRINLVSYEENQFAWAEDTLLEGSLKRVRDGNKCMAVFHSDNPLQVGDTLELSNEQASKSIELVAMLSSSTIKPKAEAETIICSEKTFRDLTGQKDYTVIDLQLSKKAAEEDVNAIRSLAGPNIKFSDQRNSNNEVKGAYYSFALFTYGFLVFIALITLFNIVNSIAMGVSARMKQYGAMRAIGMGDRQLIRMVTAEAITYALVGSITGCILGLPLNKLLFENMVTFRWGDPWSIPFDSLGIIVAIVMFSALLAVRGPARRIHHMSIVDTVSAL